MFNIGPFEFMVLAAVAIIVFGPEKLPQLTKDAARMLKTLRDMAQGARTQLTEELGPEFSNFDLNSLNPKTAIRNALLAEDEDFSSYDPRKAFQKALNGDENAGSDKISLDKPAASNGFGYTPEPDGSYHTGLPSDSDPVAEPMAGTAPLSATEKAPYDPDST